jgi:ATP-binding cassette subfamily B protein RaxB
MFGRELHRHMLWQNRLVDSVNADIRVARIGIWQSAANTVIFGVSNILLIWLAIRLSMAGGFSVGMVIAFLAYKEQFVGKTAAFINQAIAFRMLNLHLERMGEIALTPEDIAFDGEDRHRRLEGRLELRNVRYRYAPSDPWVLEDVSLSIAAGEHVAITGPSGAGKSTLAAILLGLVQPTEGEVLIDGEPIRQFGLRAYRRQIGAVLQDDALFAGSLIDNIAFADDQADPERALVAASAAAIHAEILAMPMQYNTLVGDMGSALSGGQRQRILLARALYRLPSPSYSPAG